MSSPSVSIVSGGGATSAAFMPEAGMICSSLEHEGEQRLDLGQGVEAYAERGKTMGIPLLYPWANRLAGFELEVAGRPLNLPHDGKEIPQDPNGLPIHGVLPGLMRWQATASGDRLEARLDWDGEPLLRLYPFRHQVRLEAAVEDGALTLATTVIASSEDPVPVSFGFHPYLRLPGPRQSWRVSLPDAERLLLDERSLPTGAREELRPREFELGDSSWDDGLVPRDSPARYEARTGDHDVTLTAREGFAYGQVYAPPGHDFICFEPMTAPTNALGSGEGLRVLAPGEEHRAVFSVGVS